jgi:hypothetical protein
VRLTLAAVGLLHLVVAAGITWAADAGDTPTGPGGAGANVERFLMEGTEIQGTLEKPHVVYVVPWKDASRVEGNIPLRRSFEHELLEPVDRSRFERRLSRGTSHGTGGGTR